MKTLKPSVLALIAANLAPLVGVFWLGWDSFSILLLFWLENVVIGLFNVLRMGVAPAADSHAQSAKLFLIPFFIIHFGAFTMGHGFLLFSFFSDAGGLENSDLSNLIAVAWDQVLVRHLGWSLFALFASHGVSFVTNTLMAGEFRNIKLAQQLHKPYGRIFIMHATVLFGAFFIQKTGDQAWALVILVMLKLAVDLRSHLAERRGLIPVLTS